MKKVTPVLTALALGLSSHACAQSNVALYGMMDMGISQDRGGINGTSTRATSGMATQSRWGLRGSEDLGGGMAAFFTIEGGIHVDDGSSTQGNTLFGRTSIVGLRGKFGAVSAGLQDTPLFTTLNTIVDPLRNGVARSNNLMSASGFRAANSVLYRSATWHGFSGDLMWAAREQSAGRALGGSFGYGKGPLNIRLALHNRNNALAGSARNTLLGASYDAGAAKLFAGLGVDKGVNSASLNNTTTVFGRAPLASTDSNSMLLGVSVPRGASTWVASYIRKDDRTARNQDARQYALAYMYALSKRTDVYSSYALISNRNGASYTEGNSEEPGTGNRQWTTGLRHRF
jgi:predicted porin